MSIDPRAVIDPGAVIADDVSIGPYSIIGADVEIGAGTWIGPHVVIQGPTRIGRDNKFYQFSSIGEVPQDKKYHGEQSALVIGDGNVVREFCTLNRGTDDGGGETRIGSDNWIMAYVHIAHDCLVGDHTIFANNASLAGHVRVEDHAILGGFTLVHQFTAIGAHSFTGMGSAISKDVPPYVMVNGNPAAPFGLNSEGLKRRGFSSELRSAIKQAYKLLYRSGKTTDEAIQGMSELAAQHDEVAYFVEFLRNSQRGVIR
ncbi:MAG: acyl-ACP--UDP-N-acetylglucosamine O-acyltransferase [Gammaproteobacteria bacterium]|nr:acyl-ACP--UDP-N-acetylglucosamine O-acyltransferase [Gammaproteobacteria bacterium]